MTDYSLDKLRAKFPALDAHMRGDHAELLRSAAADPRVAQIRAATNPRLRTLEKGGVPSDRPMRTYSPSAREHPIISAGLDRAQNTPPDYDMVGLRGMDRIYSNTGRPALPLRPVKPGDYAGRCREYTASELRTEERTRLGITKAEQRELDAEYERGLDVAEYGGSPATTVILHLDEFTDERGALACVVPMGWSPWRIVQVLAVGSRVCYWCGEASKWPQDHYLLVGTGGFLRVFATCAPCRNGFERDLERDFGHVGLDWIISDDYMRLAGFPDDRYC